MPLTAYTSKKLTDHLLGNTPFTIPAQIWFGLHTASPTTLGLATYEVAFAGTGYARMNMAGLLSTADINTGYSQLLSALISPIATADWGTITHVSISDAAVSGNMLFFSELVTAELIETGGQFQRVPGQVNFRLI
jgi:hypothetical protein